MTAKNRRELKQLYRTGAQPTEQDYADVFDSVFNQIDDGMFKPVEPHLPLRIKGNGAGLHVLDLYDDDTHNWRISLLANTDSGYNIADPTGNSHFFMEDGSGNVGLGVTKPQAKLHISQSAALGDAMYVQDATGDITPSRISNDGNVYIHSLKGADGAPANATAAEDTSLYVNGSVNILNESISSTSYLHINGSGSIAINGQAVESSPHLQVNSDSQFTGNMELTQDLRVKGRLIVEKEMEIKATIGADGQVIKLGDTAGDQVELPGKLNSGTLSPLAINGSMNISGSLTLDETHAVSSISNDITSNTASSTALLTENAIHQILPKGSIIMWSGNSIPSGWALCDGASHNGITTPNLSGRFIVASGGGYSTGSTGGQESVTLTATQSGMPAHTVNGSTSSDGDHTHPYYDKFGVEIGDGDNASDHTFMDYLTTENRDTGSAGAHTHSISATILGQDAAQPHENRPPYYALAFIMKIVG